VRPEKQTAQVVEIGQRSIMHDPAVSRKLDNTWTQGEFVLARNIKIVKELTRLLDISPLIVYNSYRLHDGGTINLKP
jgi:hypothetical protein